MRNDLILLLFMTPFPLYAQSAHFIFSPVESSLSNITAVSDGGYPLFHNPSAIRATHVFAGLAMYYRGTGITGIQAGASLKKGILTMGVGVKYIGDNIYKWYYGLTTISADLNTLRVGLGAGHVHESFLGQKRDLRNLVTIGFHLPHHNRVTAGVYARLDIFQGHPNPEYAAGIRYKIHELVYIYFHVHFIDKPEFSIASLVKFRKKISLRFGIDIQHWSSSIGLEYGAGNILFFFSMNFHAYLGSRLQTGFIFTKDSNEAY